ncbi:MAG: microcin self-immunity protein [Candidatus Midichloriaceae bacterium]|jgi:muramoyltetrapeptide carboxypeptidase|nr:microcin self-immunity protein [Candidatus Midichloriaceae bacterium]
MAQSARVVEVLAPSGPAALPSSKFDIFVHNGLELFMRPDLLSDICVYEANSVEYKLSHLVDANNDESVLVMWALRGGYSSTKIAEKISAMQSLPQKKFIVGFSDLTAIFAALNKHHDWLCVHGPVIKQIENGTVNPKCIEQALDIILSKTTTLSIDNLKPLNSYTGDVNGKLVGGNLAVLETTIGTPWQIECRGAILFLEDVNEPGYKVDRMLTHLKQSGTIEGVRAIIFGEFRALESEVDAVNYALIQFANSMTCPVYKTDAFGHGYENTPLVIGADAIISAQMLTYNWDGFKI